MKIRFENDYGGTGEIIGAEKDALLIKFDKDDDVLPTYLNVHGWKFWVEEGSPSRIVRVIYES